MRQAFTQAAQVGVEPVVPFLSLHFFVSCFIHCPVLSDKRCKKKPQNILTCYMKRSIAPVNNILNPEDNSLSLG